MRIGVAAWSTGYHGLGCELRCRSSCQIRRRGESPDTPGARIRCHLYRGLPLDDSTSSRSPADGESFWEPSCDEDGATERARGTTAGAYVEMRLGGDGQASHNTADEVDDHAGPTVDEAPQPEEGSRSAGVAAVGSSVVRSRQRPALLQTHAWGENEDGCLGTGDSHTVVEPIHMHLHEARAARFLRRF